MKYRLQSLYNHLVGRAASIVSPFYFKLLEQESKLWMVNRGVNKDSVGGGKYFEFGARSAPKFFLPPPRIFFTPPQKNIIMYIKLLVLVGFDLNFPLISGIYKLHQIKASFPTFQLSRFIIVIHFTLTTKIFKKTVFILL